MKRVLVAAMVTALVGAVLGVGYLAAEGHGWAASGLFLAVVFALAVMIPWRCP